MKNNNCFEEFLFPPDVWETHKFSYKREPSWDFPGEPVVKNSPCNVGDVGLIQGLGTKEEGMATNCSILVWEIPGTEEPGRL